MRLAAAFLAVLIGLRAMVADAQTLTVRAGEHAGFSRLVLDIGADRDWRLDGEGEARRLTLSPPVDGFETGDVFRLVPRTRLAALEGGDALDLRLGCDCPVEVTRYEGRYLVIDIHDPGYRPASDPGPVPEDAAAASDDDPDADAVEAGLDRAAAAGAGGVAGAAASAGNAAGLPDMTRLLAGPSLGPDLGPAAAASPMSAAGGIDLETAAQIMAEQLARAAASGLLDSAPLRPFTDADPAAASAPAEPVAPPPDAGLTGPGSGPAADLPLRAETAFDAALHRTQAAEPRQPRLTCPDTVLPIAAWSASDRFDDGLGQLRLALYDARDVLQRDAVLALARHYLRFGFGAEAADWLDRIPAPPAELQRIAALVDGRPAPVPAPMGAAQDALLICSDEDLVWHVLGGTLGSATQPGLQPGGQFGGQPGGQPAALTEELAGRLQRATAALPDALRDQVAPRVARRLQAEGHPNPARNLRDLLHRAGTLPETALLQLDIDLGLVPGGADATRQALALALRDDGGDPLTAMAQAMGFDRGLGLAIPPERVEAAEALLRETAGTAEAAPLWHETVLALGAARDLPRLIALLDRADLPEPARMATLTALFADRAAARDTATLYVLARLFGAGWTAEGSEAGRARVAAIAELRAAGLAGAADALRAGQRMLILPARPAAPAPEDDPLRSGWQGGDWPRIARDALPPHAEIADRMAGLPAASAVDRPPGSPPVLSALAARIDDSRRLRAEVAALLDNPAPRPAEAAP
ncbi:hypothetical protein [Roseicyclus sp.]